MFHSFLIHICSTLLFVSYVSDSRLLISAHKQACEQRISSITMCNFLHFSATLRNIKNMTHSGLSLLSRLFMFWGEDCHFTIYIVECQFYPRNILMTIPKSNMSYLYLYFHFHHLVSFFYPLDFF